jgi:GNAT superfamily N-acetyltransferase
MPYQICTLKSTEFASIASLIHRSTNAWYAAHNLGTIFGGEAEACEVFPRVYEALDPDCCLITIDSNTQQLIGSCFYHPRETHISIGIVNVDPEHFGKGIARALVAEVIKLSSNKPLRLVSSALNLDSYSVYTKLGFVPRVLYQDLILPADRPRPPTPNSTREATLADLDKIVALETELVGITRPKDYAYFLTNTEKIWHTSVIENPNGGLDGVLVSVKHAASNLLGPGVMRTEQHAIDLIAAELNAREFTPVMIVPADATKIIQTLYGWGARNCELHVLQVRGDYTKAAGVFLPTFLPETG